MNVIIVKVTLKEEKNILKHQKAEVH